MFPHKNFCCKKEKSENIDNLENVNCGTLK